jgi:hypothetical protein
VSKLTFALQVQHDGQRVPLQHLLAFVIQLNSQCGSPSLLNKGKGQDDNHWLSEFPSSHSLWPGPHTAVWHPLPQLSGARLHPCSPLFSPLPLCPGRWPQQTCRKYCLPWSALPQHPSRSRHLRPHREGRER